MKKTNKKSQPTENIQVDVIDRLSQKLESLERQIHDRDAKINSLENMHKNADVGSQKFGVSPWKEWENGAEKGYYRSLYVDVRTLSTPRG